MHVKGTDDNVDGTIYDTKDALPIIRMELIIWRFRIIKDIQKIFCEDL